MRFAVEADGDRERQPAERLGLVVLRLPKQRVPEAVHGQQHVGVPGRERGTRDAQGVALDLLEEAGAAGSLAGFLTCGLRRGDAPGDPGLARGQGTR